jgi:hypothetical protein
MTQQLVIEIRVKMKRLYIIPETEIVKVELQTFITGSPVTQTTDKTTGETRPGGDVAPEYGGDGIGDDVGAKSFRGGVTDWIGWED